MPLSISLSGTFPAPINDVFTAWTSPPILEKWFFPGGWSTDTVNEVTLRDEPPSMSEVNDARDPVDEGGALRKGEAYIHTSEYNEVTRPTKIVYSWSSPAVTSTVVTVLFRTTDEGTEVSLTHDGFLTEDICEIHKVAWQLNLERLGEYLRRTALH
jgi:uncharacterized protein YndB with AHSA1/START domain